MTERSPLERAQLRYCAPRGIPLSVFKGRTVYPGDPQWLPSDMEAALEWQADQDRSCSACGRDLDESTSPDSEDRYTATGIRCFACQAISHAAHKLAGRDDTDPLAGMRYRIKDAAEVDDVAPTAR